MWLWKVHGGFSEDALSYRSEAGVKFNMDKDGNFHLDFEDPQTKDLIDQRLMEMARMEVVDGKLVIKGGDDEV